jgi:DNA repair protein RadC
MCSERLRDRSAEALSDYELLELLSGRLSVGIDRTLYVQHDPIRRLIIVNGGS